MKICSFFLTITASALLLSCSTSTNAHAETYSAKVLIDSTTSLCKLIKPAQLTQLHRQVAISKNDFYEEKTERENRVSMEEILLNNLPGTEYFIEVFGQSKEVVNARLNERCPFGIQIELFENEEDPVINQVNKKIVDSGNPKNRIDVVFMGDGYTEKEESRFFSDIERLTKEMFSAETFAQYLPLFNIWAVFVPSEESGVGVGGKARNTAFGLYRDGTELRGLYALKPSKARSVCDAVGQYACDFPSLIGNDDFYGGLGGEFVISTRSPTSGTVVLRHEMGHNFGKVGEEYDGGYVYSGANSASNLNSINWKHWLTDPSNLREEKMVQLYQKHIWHDLKKGSFKISFTSTGKFKRSYILISASGVDTADSLTVTLDGRPLPWKTNGIKDRSFYSWTNSTNGFTAGDHELVIQGGGSFDSPIIKQLCNAVIYEYADENEFKMDDPDYIGVYPTWDINRRKSVRPDNERCLMRNMLSTKFCRVCQENMWLKFMERIDFIDEVFVNDKQVELKLIPLGQLRMKEDSFLMLNPEVASQEKYTIQWIKGGKEELQFKDQFKVDLSKASSSSPGQWTVRVKFETPNVRLDPKNFLTSERTFTIK